MKKIAILLLAAAMLVSTMCNQSTAATARDSAWLADTANMSPNIKKAKSGVPIGTIIAWPYSTMPTSGEWLECNDQTVSAAAYPDFTSKFGSVLPDLRGCLHNYQIVLK